MLDNLKKLFHPRKPVITAKPPEDDEVVGFDFDTLDIRKRVIEVVAYYKNLKPEKVEDNVVIGREMSSICPILCFEFGKMIFGDTDTTVGELIEQLEAE